MSIRDEFLAVRDGNYIRAAAYLADQLSQDQPEEFKVGYTIPNAILAAQEVFPEVSEEDIRAVNGWDK